jgi:hypothetical protein
MMIHAHYTLPAYRAVVCPRGLRTFAVKAVPETDVVRDLPDELTLYVLLNHEDVSIVHSRVEWLLLLLGVFSLD